ncbi:MAG: hypothetical protein J0L92_11635 [Deltaproteobacteria bacterium]|nr:hypothetical protein [Deltaproteobacteria bacterium]
MSSKPSLTRVPSVPALVRRAIPVAVAASIVTGCSGDPGAPLLDAGISVSPDAPAAPVGDAGISAPDDAR